MRRKLFLFLLCSMLATPILHAQPKANHVVLIGLDGWASHDLDKAHDIPNLRSLMGTLDIRDMESPLVFFGKNVRIGYQIDAPLVQYDIAATIAYILDLDIPEAWRGKPVKQAFE